jgi:hypothetical protein
VGLLFDIIIWNNSFQIDNGVQIRVMPNSQSYTLVETITVLAAFSVMLKYYFK